jgi:hypothetical protein
MFDLEDGYRRVRRSFGPYVLNYTASIPYDHEINVSVHFSKQTQTALII